MPQKGFHFDMKVCIGCKACQVACKDKNNLEAGFLFRKVHGIEGGKYPKPWTYNLSIACNHCAEPKCVKNCPTGALAKRADGVVTSDRTKCIGCRLCTWSCPYGAPVFLEKEGKVGKCNLCADLLDQGEEPACVASCVMRALHFGEIEELRKTYGGTSDFKGMPNSSLTQPSITVTTRKEAER